MTIAAREPRRSRLGTSFRSRTPRTALGNASGERPQMNLDPVAVVRAPYRGRKLGSVAHKSGQSPRQVFLKLLFSETSVLARGP